MQSAPAGRGKWDHGKKLKVNAIAYRWMGRGHSPLLWVLAEDHIADPAQYGLWEIAQCGSCTVTLSRRCRPSCVILSARSRAKKEITTIEVCPEGQATLVQQAWAELDVRNAVPCQPGMIIAVRGMLITNPKPHRRRHSTRDHQYLPVRHVRPAYAKAFHLAKTKKA